MFLLFTSTILMLASQVLAQQASSSWRKPNVTVSQSDRISLADAAIQEAIGFLDTTNGFFPDPGKFHAVHHSTLVGDGLNFGHAGVQAYTKYKSPLFLDYAKQVWWAMESYTLSQSELDIGTIASKSFTLETTCRGITMAGGTFRAKSPTSSDINVGATGGFLVLSALLAEATNDAMYLNAAQASADFIHAHLYSVQNVVQDTISGRESDACALVQENVEASYNSGLFIEGLAILYSITQNASIHDIITETVTAAISYSGWQGSDGIIANGADQEGDMTLPRGLATVNARNASTSELRSYIDAYLSVQFNAVVDLATTAGSTIYALDWHGPPSSIFKPVDQTTAIQVLVNAINLNQPLSTGSSNGSSPGSVPPSSPPVIHKTSKIGPIVGGLVGGLVLLVLFFAGALLLWRRRSRNGKGSGADLQNIPPAINPYTLRFGDAFSPRSTQPSTAGGSSSMTPGPAIQTGSIKLPTMSSGSGPVMGEVPAPVGGLRYPTTNIDEFAEDEPPVYSAMEISGRRTKN
ncbi:hypothetical protein B0H19DRAFT_1262307 [Mycena capillaripes]|nr:hypothetical protein B0H19DRAFT_1262307 [Mycena capillaripes]